MRPTLDAGAVGVSVDGMRCRWKAPDGSVSISFNCDDIDRLRALTIDAFLSLPKRGVEIGGFLLGRIDSTDPLAISIEGFEPVACEHRYGPSYVLSEADRGHFIELFNRLKANRDRQVVGFYRTYTPREPALDAADQDLIRTYFSGLQNAFLLLKPLSSLECAAAFVFWKNGQLQCEPQHALFAFRADQMAVPAESPAAPEGPAGPPDLTLPTAVSPAISAPAAVIHETQTALRAPAPILLRVRPPRFTEEDLEPSRQIPWFWVLMICLLAITAGAALYTWESAHQQTSRQRTVAESREITPLPPPLSAVPQAALKQTETPAPEPPQAKSIEKSPSLAPWVAPVALHEVQPRIPPGIRARIHDRIIVPVVVHVTASGKVTGAFADGNGDSLYRYLGEQAVVAARRWRFQPARSKTGTPMEASKTVYFVFMP